MSAALDRIVKLLEHVPAVPDTAHGYLDLLGEVVEPHDTVAQRFMRSGLLPKIYEDLWRPVLFGLSKGGPLGPSTSDEYELARASLGLDGHGAQTVLDVACGPGNVTRALAEGVAGRSRGGGTGVGDGGLVVGVDASATMLGRAVAATTTATGTGTATGAGTGTRTSTASGADARSDPGARSGSGSDARSDPGSDSDAGSDPGARSDPGADAGTDSGSGPGADTGDPEVGYVRGDAVDLPFRAGSFDAVCCYGALYLFDDPWVAMDAMTRVLMPGGRIVILTTRRFGAPLIGRGSDILGRLSGVRMFGSGEVSEALSARGFVEVRQRSYGVMQFVSGRLS